MRGILIGGLWLLAFTATAADTLRVGSHLLVSGDSAAQVRQLLGRPASVAHHRGSRHRGVRVPASERWLYRVDGREIVVVLVDGEVDEILQRP